MAEPKKIKPKGAPKMPQPAQPPLLEGVSTKKAKQPAGNQASLANLPDSKYAPIALPRASEFKPGDIMGNDQEYVQMCPLTYSGSGKKTSQFRWDNRYGADFVPEGGGRLSFRAQTYNFDASKNLVRATSSALTAGVRDEACYAERKGDLQEETVYFHILGIDFGHRDGRVGKYGGFVGPAELNGYFSGSNGRTPHWFIEERAARKIAEQLHREGKDYLIEVEAPNWQDGRPEKMRIRVWSGGKVIDPPDGPAKWVQIPKAPPKTTSPQMAKVVSVELSGQGGEVAPKYSETAPIKIINSPVPLKAPSGKGADALKGNAANSEKPDMGAVPIDKTAPSASTEKSLETSRPAEMTKPPQLPRPPLQSAEAKGEAPERTKRVPVSASVGRPGALHKRLYRDPQDFPNISSPKMRPGERVARGAGGVLEIARIASEHAAIKHDFNLAMRYSAARTLSWWADKGVFPVATAVKDNWWGDSDDYMGTLANSLPEMDQFDGLEVSALTEDVQYQAFDKWASSSLKNYDDYVRYFLQAQDAGVYRDNEEKVWKVRVWKWNDWLGNSDFSLEEDSRITKFMEPLYQQLLKNTQAEIANMGKSAELKGVGRVVGIRRFLKTSWDKGAFDPSNPDVRLITGWGFEPTFFEVKTDRAIPPEYTLVTGGDLNTYARLRNTTVIDEINYPVISAGPISMFKPNFDAIALLKTESLTERSPSN